MNYQQTLQVSCVTRHLHVVHVLITLGGNFAIAQLCMTHLHLGLGGLIGDTALMLQSFESQQLLNSGVAAQKCAHA